MRSLVFFLCFANVCRCVIDDAYVRSTRDSFGRTIQSLSDGKTTVTAIFNHELALIDCDVRKSNSTVAKEFLKEALSNSIPANVTISSIKLDVKKIGRKCGKYIRDTLRKLDTASNDRERISRKLFTLNKPVPGTKWCARNERPSRFEKLGPKSELDTCCKIIHKCQNAIPGYTYRDGTLNFYPWTLPSCSCVNDFIKCNQNLKKDERYFSEIYLNSLRIPCLEFKNSEVCSEHDQWGLKCVKYDTISRPAFKTLN